MKPTDLLPGLAGTALKKVEVFAADSLLGKRHTLTNLQFAKPYQSTMKVPLAPVCFPYNPNDDAHEAYDFAIPSFSVAVALPTGKLPPQIQALKEQYLITDENSHAYFVVQSAPWTPAAKVLYRPHPVLDPSAKEKQSGYWKEFDVAVAASGINAAPILSKFSKNTVVHHQDGRIAYSYGNHVINGIENRAESHAYYTVCVLKKITNTSGGRQQVSHELFYTLHWVLNEADFRVTQTIANQSAENTSVQEFADQVKGQPALAHLYTGDASPMQGLESLIQGENYPAIDRNNHPYCIDGIETITPRADRVTTSSDAADVLPAASSTTSSVITPTEESSPVVKNVPTNADFDDVLNFLQAMNFDDESKNDEALVQKKDIGIEPKSPTRTTIRETSPPENREDILLLIEDLKRELESKPAEKNTEQEEWYEAVTQEFNLIDEVLSTTASSSAETDAPPARTVVSAAKPPLEKGVILTNVGSANPYQSTVKLPTATVFTEYNPQDENFSVAVALPVRHEFLPPEIQKIIRAYDIQPENCSVDFVVQNVPAKNAEALLYTPHPALDSHAPKTASDYHRRFNLAVAAFGINSKPELSKFSKKIVTIDSTGENAPVYYVGRMPIEGTADREQSHCLYTVCIRRNTHGKQFLLVTLTWLLNHDDFAATQAIVKGLEKDADVGKFIEGVEATSALNHLNTASNNELSPVQAVKFLTKGGKYPQPNAANPYAISGFPSDKWKYPFTEDVDESALENVAEHPQPDAEQIALEAKIRQLHDMVRGQFNVDVPLYELAEKGAEEDLISGLRDLKSVGDKLGLQDVLNSSRNLTQDLEKLNQAQLPGHMTDDAVWIRDLLVEDKLPSQASLLKHIQARTAKYGTSNLNQTAEMLERITFILRLRTLIATGRSGELEADSERDESTVAEPTVIRRDLVKVLSTEDDPMAFFFENEAIKNLRVVITANNLPNTDLITLVENLGDSKEFSRLSSTLVIITLYLQMWQKVRALVEAHPEAFANIAAPGTDLKTLLDNSTHIKLAAVLASRSYDLDLIKSGSFELAYRADTVMKYRDQFSSIRESLLQRIAHSELFPELNPELIALKKLIEADSTDYMSIMGAVDQDDLAGTGFIVAEFGLPGLVKLAFDLAHLQFKEEAEIAAIAAAEEVPADDQEQRSDGEELPQPDPESSDSEEEDEPVKPVLDLPPLAEKERFLVKDHLDEPVEKIKDLEPQPEPQPDLEEEESNSESSAESADETSEDEDQPENAEDNPNQRLEALRKLYFQVHRAPERVLEIYKNRTLCPPNEEINGFVLPVAGEGDRLNDRKLPPRLAVMKAKQFYAMVNLHRYVYEADRRVAVMNAVIHEAEYMIANDLPAAKAAIAKISAGLAGDEAAKSLVQQSIPDHKKELSNPWEITDFRRFYVIGHKSPLTRDHQAALMKKGEKFTEQDLDNAPDEAIYTEDNLAKVIASIRIEKTYLLIRQGFCLGSYEVAIVAVNLNDPARELLTLVCDRVDGEKPNYLAYAEAADRRAVLYQNAGDTVAPGNKFATTSMEEAQKALTDALKIEAKRRIDILNPIFQWMNEYGTEIIAILKEVYPGLQRLFDIAVMLHTEQDGFLLKPDNDKAIKSVLYIEDEPVGPNVFAEIDWQLIEALIKARTDIANTILEFHNDRLPNEALSEVLTARVWIALTVANGGERRDNPQENLYAHVMEYIRVVLINPRTEPLLLDANNPAHRMLVLKPLAELCTAEQLTAMYRDEVLRPLMVTVTQCEAERRIDLVNPALNAFKTHSRDINLTGFAAILTELIYTIRNPELTALHNFINNDEFPDNLRKNNQHDCADIMAENLDESMTPEMLDQLQEAIAQAAEDARRLGMLRKLQAQLHQTPARALKIYNANRGHCPPNEDINVFILAPADEEDNLLANRKLPPALSVAQMPSPQIFFEEVNTTAYYITADERIAKLDAIVEEFLPLHKLDMPDTTPETKNAMLSAQIIQRLGMEQDAVGLFKQSVLAAYIPETHDFSDADFIRYYVMGHVVKIDGDYAALLEQKAKTFNLAHLPHNEMYLEDTLNVVLTVLRMQKVYLLMRQGFCLGAEKINELVGGLEGARNADAAALLRLLPDRIQGENPNYLTYSEADDRPLVLDPRPGVAELQQAHFGDVSVAAVQAALIPALADESARRIGIINDIILALNFFGNDDNAQQARDQVIAELKQEYPLLSRLLDIVAMFYGIGDGLLLAAGNAEDRDAVLYIIDPTRPADLVNNPRQPVSPNVFQRSELPRLIANKHAERVAVANENVRRLDALRILHAQVHQPPARVLEAYQNLGVTPPPNADVNGFVLLPATPEELANRPLPAGLAVPLPPLAPALSNAEFNAAVNTHRYYYEADKRIAMLNAIIREGQTLFPVLPGDMDDDEKIEKNNVIRDGLLAHLAGEAFDLLDQAIEEDATDPASTWSFSTGMRFFAIGHHWRNNDDGQQAQALADKARDFTVPDLQNAPDRNTYTEANLASILAVMRIQKFNQLILRPLVCLGNANVRGIVGGLADGNQADFLTIVNAYNLAAGPQYLNYAQDKIDWVMPADAADAQIQETRFATENIRAIQATLAPELAREASRRIDIINPVVERLNAIGNDANANFKRGVILRTILANNPGVRELLNIIVRLYNDHNKAEFDENDIDDRDSVLYIVDDLDEPEDLEDNPREPVPPNVFRDLNLVRLIDDAEFDYDVEANRARDRIRMANLILDYHNRNLHDVDSLQDLQELVLDVIDVGHTPANVPQENLYLHVMGYIRPELLAGDDDIGRDAIAINPLLDPDDHTHYPLVLDPVGPYDVNALDDMYQDLVLQRVMEITEEQEIIRRFALVNPSLQEFKQYSVDPNLARRFTDNLATMIADINDDDLTDLYQFIIDNHRPAQFVMADIQHRTVIMRPALSPLMTPTLAGQLRHIIENARRLTEVQKLQIYRRDRMHARAADLLGAFDADGKNEEDLYVEVLDNNDIDTLAGYLELNYALVPNQKVETNHNRQNDITAFNIKKNCVEIRFFHAEVADLADSVWHDMFTSALPVPPESWNHFQQCVDDLERVLHDLNHIPVFHHVDGRATDFNLTTAQVNRLKVELVRIRDELLRIRFGVHAGIHVLAGSMQLPDGLNNTNCTTADVAARINALIPNPEQNLFAHRLLEEFGSEAAAGGAPGSALVQVEANWEFFRRVDNNLATVPTNIALEAAVAARGTIPASLESAFYIQHMLEIDQAFLVAGIEYPDQNPLTTLAPAIQTANRDDMTVAEIQALRVSPNLQEQTAWHFYQARKFVERNDLNQYLGFDQSENPLENMDEFHKNPPILVTFSRGPSCVPEALFYRSTDAFQAMEIIEPGRGLFTDLPGGRSLSNLEIHVGGRIRVLAGLENCVTMMDAFKLIVGDMHAHPHERATGAEYIRIMQKVLLHALENLLLSIPDGFEFSRYNMLHGHILKYMENIWQIIDMLLVMHKVNEALFLDVNMTGPANANDPNFFSRFGIVDTPANVAANNFTAQEMLGMPVGGPAGAVPGVIRDAGIIAKLQHDNGTFRVNPGLHFRNGEGGHKDAFKDTCSAVKNLPDHPPINNGFGI